MYRNRPSQRPSVENKSDRVFVSGETYLVRGRQLKNDLITVEDTRLGNIPVNHVPLA
jgi:hypothetical protein